MRGVRPDPHRRGQPSAGHWSYLRRQDGVVSQVPRLLITVVALSLMADRIVASDVESSELTNLALGCTLALILLQLTRA